MRDGKYVRYASLVFALRYILGAFCGELSASECISLRYWSGGCSISSITTWGILGLVAMFCINECLVCRDLTDCPLGSSSTVECKYL